MRINIAIDGPSASGKSTVANEICRLLDYVHLDTGAMYRCVGKACLDEQIDITDLKQLENLLERIQIELKPDGTVYLNGEDVSNAIRTDEISMMASNVAAIEYVRVRLVEMQQKMAQNKGFVMDGRDIGTVVLPDAEVKFYITASSEVRAQRRYLENQQRGIECDLQTLKEEIEQRDYQDMHREVSPLMQADDAILVDTSNLTIEEATNVCMGYINEKRKDIL